MSIFDSIWEKLRSSKKYREEFVAAHAKQAIPHQARALMKARGWKQEDLAELSGLSQGTVSRAVDPSYGNLTLNTIIRLAAGFDVAFIGRFVPFSDLARWTADLPAESWDIATFKEEDAKFQAFSEAVSHKTRYASETSKGVSGDHSTGPPVSTQRELQIDSDVDKVIPFRIPTGPGATGSGLAAAGRR